MALWEMDSPRCSGGRLGLAALCLPLLMSVWASGQSVFVVNAETSDVSTVSAESLAPGALPPESVILSLDVVPPQSGAALPGTLSLPPLFTGLLETGVPPEGDMPLDAAFTPDGSQVVIACHDSQNLVVHDATTAAFIRAIPLSGSPLSVAVTPDGTRAVTANTREGTASIVDLTSGVELAAVPVGLRPGLVRITPDGSRAVTGNTGDGTFSVLNIAALTEERRFPGGTFTRATSTYLTTDEQFYIYRDFALAPDNVTLVHPDRLNDNIEFFDITDGSVTSLPSSSEPAAVALSADGSVGVVYHQDFSEPSVTVLDVPGRAIIRTVALTGVSTAVMPNIVLSAAGDRAAIPGPLDVRVLQTATGAFSVPLSVGGLVEDLDLTADGARCLVTSTDDISILDLGAETLETVDPPESAGPWMGAVSPVGERGASLDPARDLLILSNHSAPLTLTPNTPVGASPEGDGVIDVAINGDGTRAVLVNRFSDNVQVADLETHEILTTIDTDQFPLQALALSDGVRVAVDSFSLGLMIIDTQTFDVSIPGIVGHEMTLSPDGQWLYGQGPGSNELIRIDLSTFTKVEPSLTTSGAFGPMAVNADGTLLASLDTVSFDGLGVTVVDLASWSELGRVPLSSSDFAEDLIFNPVSPELYFTLVNSVEVVDLTASPPTIEASVTLPDILAGPLAVTSDGLTLFVGIRGSVEVIDLSSRAIVNSIPLLKSNDVVSGLRLSPDGTQLLVSAGHTTINSPDSNPFHRIIQGEFLIVDVATQTVSQSFDMGLPPLGLATSADFTVAAMPAPLGDGILVVDLNPPTAARLWALYN
jgi:DNA-binding beta-propeller fold protein YncE